MDASPPHCARHPDVETRLRCSACDTPICFDCSRSAAVGFKCPDCAAPLEAASSPRGADRGVRPRRGIRDRPGSKRSGAGHGDAGGVPDEPLPIAHGIRATAIGLLAALVGGAVLGPVLEGGAFFLLSSGFIGWVVARVVFRVAGERRSPYLRAIAMTLAGFTVAVGLAIANSWGAGTGKEIVFLAYPAAVYGSWIVVRQR